EYIAYKYFIRLGYNFIESNYYSTSGEIDLIFSKDDLTIFIEVKGLTKNYNNLLETVSKKKKRRILKTAYSWLNKYNLEDSFWRIDFVGIIYKDNKYIITHVENIDMNFV
ncbi:YraN family protein, partial [Candidatus Dojkabacteria bacterium]|nr:YraN family protein [Candidatus Dojkabacteria bacterium]